VGCDNVLSSKNIPKIQRKLLPSSVGYFWSWRRQKVPLKYWYLSASLQGIKSQKTAILLFLFFFLKRFSVVQLSLSDLQYICNMLLQAYMQF
jgi:hypothetical protein